MFGDNDVKLADFDLMLKRNSSESDTEEITTILSTDRE